LEVPVRVTVLVTFVNVEPAPDVSQSPETVQEPEVSVIVPEVPPVIVTLETATEDAFAVRIPPLPTETAPPVSPRFAVARALVLERSLTVEVPPQTRDLEAMVNVCAAAELDVKVTLLNSLTPRFDPPNVMMTFDAEENRTVPVPALHEADVELFVQAPLNSQPAVPPNEK